MFAKARSGSLVMLIVVAGARSAFGWTSPAPDVVLYATPSMQKPLLIVAAQYTRSSGVKVHLLLAPPDGLYGLLKHRARDDVVVADEDTMRRLAQDGSIVKSSVIVLGQDAFVLAGGFSVKSAGKEAAALLPAFDTVVPDATTAASFDGASVLHTALPDVAPRHVIGVADVGEVLQKVEDNPGLLGLVHNTDLAGTGLIAVASVPGPATTMSAALVTQGQSGNAAALLAFMTGPVGQAAMRTSGLEPVR